MLNFVSLVYLYKDVFSDKNLICGSSKVGKSIFLDHFRLVVALYL